MGEDKAEDFDLLAQFNAGSEKAFTRIVEKHAGPLLNFLHRYTHNRADSEDIAQEALLRLYKAAPGLKPDAKLSTILYKIAYNLAVDQARRAKSRNSAAPTQALDAGERGQAPLRVSSPAASPAALLETSLRNREIAAGLAELPDAQRSALILKAYEHRSYAEIAEIMGLSDSAVDSLIFRARQSLARKLANPR
ncbi:MAG: hypothetical protein A2X32_05395 [Elusimicrobia bacterium GWC2_64_44]|nr:MAG: hypothetical protein A2X32_05395 [Elusimicrobia bacterium GWC2_64_44]